ncbi:VOC family protein [Niveispirillum lacus]|nr:VOC family protein [Niveispirillum lacus]
MKKLTFTLLAAVFLSGPVGAEVKPAGADSASYDGVHYKRATILTTDLDRSLTFYRDLMGLKVEVEMPLKPTSYAYVMFNIDSKAQMRMAMLSSDTQQRTLAIIEVKGAPIHMPTAPRPHAMVLQSPDLPGMAARARERGLTVFKELDLTTVDGRQGKEQGLLDPDGHLVILYQLNP